MTERTSAEIKIPQAEPLEDRKIQQVVDPRGQQARMKIPEQSKRPPGKRKRG